MGFGHNQKRRRAAPNGTFLILTSGTPRRYGKTSPISTEIAPVRSEPSLKSVQKSAQALICDVSPTASQTACQAVGNGARVLTGVPVNVDPVVPVSSTVR